MTQRAKTQSQILDDDLDQLITPRSKQMAQITPLAEPENESSGIGFWLVGLGLLTLLAFMGFELYLSLHQAWLLHPVLALILGVLALAFSLLLVWVLSRELMRYWRIGQIQQLQREARDIIQRENALEVRDLLNRLMAQQKQSKLAQPLVSAYQQTINNQHSAQEQLYIYETMVAKPLLAQAKSRLNNEALRAGGMGLLSPNSLVETLLLLWRSARVVKMLAEIYGYRPGLVGNFKLLKMSLENVLIQQTSDMLIEEGVNMLGKGLLSGLSQQAGKAASTGVLVKRIGRATIDLMNVVTATPETAKDL